jgi:cell division protein FtsW (lipid II flippase)
VVVSEGTGEKDSRATERFVTKALILHLCGFALMFCLYLRRYKWLRLEAALVILVSLIDMIPFPSELSAA